MKRRHFLQTMAAGAASLSAISVLGGAPKMQSALGLQLFSVREALAKDLEGTLEKLRKTATPNSRSMATTESFSAELLRSSKQF